MGEAQFDSRLKSAEYRRLFDAHYAHIRAYCARRVGAQEAEDLTAEVFTVVWRRMDDVPSGDEALPWMYGVAFRVVSHYRRGTGRRKRLSLKVASEPIEVIAGPGVQIVRHAEYDRVLEAATRLRSLDQEILRLAVWEELSHQQIAHVLDCSVVAARQRFHRAKQSLLREYIRLGGAVPIPAVAPKGGEQ